MYHHVSHSDGRSCCQSHGSTAEPITTSDSVDHSACMEVSGEIMDSASYPESGLRPVCGFKLSTPPLTDLCKFPHPFNWPYCKRAIQTMGVRSIRVDLSRWFIAYIVVRMRELHGLAHDTPLDHAITAGSQSQVTYEEYCELHGMSQFLSVVQMIPVERQSMAHFFICAARGINLECPRVDCGIQCDVESHGASADICNPSDPVEVSNATWHTSSVCQIQPVIHGPHVR